MEELNVTLYTYNGEEIERNLLVEKIKNKETYKLYNKDKSPFTQYNNNLMKSKFIWIDGKKRICKVKFNQSIDPYNLLHIVV